MMRDLFCHASQQPRNTELVKRRDDVVFTRLSPMFASRFASELAPDVADWKERVA